MADELHSKTIMDELQSFLDGNKTFQEVIDAVEALQANEETLQSVIDSIEALQDGTETLQGVIDEITGLRTDADIEDNEIINAKVTFADEAAQGDSVTVSIPASTVDLKRDQLYMVYVYNGSDATTISVDLEIDWEDSEVNSRTVDYVLFDSIATLSSDSMPQDALILYDGGVLKIINDTTIGLDEGYDVFVKVVRL